MNERAIRPSVSSEPVTRTRVAGSAAVAFSNIRLDFGSETVLADISFEVQRGAFVCLLGPSGCGKSTTLRIIGGLLSVSDGAIEVYDATPNLSWRRLAYVFQAPRLVPWRTALENVILGLELREPSLGAEEMRQRARSYLDMVGLLKETDKFPGMLSGGQKQRVALARALAVDPDIILMDEPFTALDYTTRKYLRNELLRIWHQTGKTIIFVTHDLEEALSLADQVVVFSNKPTRIARVIALDRPRPRDLDADPTLTRLMSELQQLFVDFGERLELSHDDPPSVPDIEEKPAPRRDWRSAVGQRLVADGFVVAMVIAWYIYSKFVPEFIIPNPLNVLRVTGELFFSPRYLWDTYTSFLRVVVSVTLSLGISGIIVCAGWYVPPLRLLVANRIIPILNAFPSIGWAILAVIWFGVNTTSVLFVEVAILLPFAMINLWEGMKALDAETLEMARSFTKTPLQILRRIILPLLFPFIFSAVRMSYGVAWKVALIAELFGAQTGLGHLLNIASQSFDTTLVFAVIIALIILVIGVERLIFDPIERRAQRQLAAVAK
ncbi:MAG: ATP-binding cassette domain-containing protein [Xanthobacteraceae bacterium]